MTMDELKNQVQEEIERLKQSDMLILTDGWTSSPHYREGYYAGRFALLLEIKRALDEL